MVKVTDDYNLKVEPARSEVKLIVLKGLLLNSCGAAC